MAEGGADSQPPLDEDPFPEDLEGVEGAGLEEDLEEPGDDWDTCSSDEEDERSSEAILAETLAKLLQDPKDAEKLTLELARDHTELLPATVFIELVLRMKYTWFQLFRALGMPHKTLVGIRDQYPRDPEVSLFEAISEWIRRQDPKPSWRALVDALRNKMLEAKLADGIAERHFTPSELKEYKSKLLPPHGSQAPPPGYEDDESEFISLIVKFVDQLGADSVFKLCLFLKHMICPDGTWFVARKHIKDKISVEGLLLPLIRDNLLVAQDMDLLIAIVKGLNRDDLMPLLRDYSVTAVIQYPILKPVRDTKRFFSLLVELHPEVIELDIEGVSYIKQDICRLICVEEIPYLLQFLGWRKPPIAVQFQVHMSLVDRIRVVVELNDSAEKLRNFSRFEIDVNGCVFSYKIDR